jgi:hypothetical protein
MAPFRQAQFVLNLDYDVKLALNLTLAECEQWNLSTSSYWKCSINLRFTEGAGNFLQNTELPTKKDVVMLFQGEEALRAALSIWRNA